MKRRIDKNKVYAFIGKITVWISLWTLGTAGFIYAFLQGMTY